tara:strand:+ start:163927 stop:164160 length:234 start_codon:yes stop_codon:yes gene_type:complete
LSGEGVAVVLRGDDASGNMEQFVTTESTEDITGVFDWTEYSIKLDKVDASTKSLLVFLVFSSDTSGEVYFDDISLTY